MTLKEVKIGKKAKITAVGGEGALRQHFLDMGVIPGAEITVVQYAPMGDPIELMIHGYELTLRLEDAAQIEVEQIEDKEEKIVSAVNQLVDLRPAAIIKKFELRKPIYKQLAAYGHMGREEIGVKWEVCDIADKLAELCK